MTTKSLHSEVRFHLSSGKNYMHWQVRTKQGGKTVDVQYYSPNEYQLEMRGCRLRNRPNKAKKVFEAGVHDVSGWVRCDQVVATEMPIDNLERVFYNPLRDPHWRRESDQSEFVWDETEYATLITSGKQVYILEERT